MNTMDTMDTKQKDYLLTIICYVVWGFQPLYYAIKPDTDAMFLLMSRILWAGVFVTSIVLVQGRGKEIIATFKKKDLMLKHIVPGAIFNFLDWGVYMWAVMNGHILATSMAYYIAPLAVCYFGVIFFKEKMTWQMGVATAIIVAGVLFAGDGFGNSPLITIILMFCFAAYAAFMKGVKEDSPLCTSVMMILAAPAAIIYIAIFRMGENGMASVDLGIQFFLIGAGIVTVLPILIYASCVKRLPMTIMGFLQYLSPTLGIVCSYLMGETMGKNEYILFGFIWTGVLLYSIVTAIREKKENRAALQEEGQHEQNQ
jgi:chloramphenicol-sensitive protein RarD